MAERLTRCPKCKDEEKSILHVTAGGTTPGKIEFYYDEEEVKHFHDPTIHYTVYTCNKGHKTTRKTSGKCPSCDWSGLDES